MSIATESDLCNMGGTASMFYSGAVEAAAGTMVGSAVSSVNSRFDQEGLDLSLYNLRQELVKIESAIIEARRRRITNQKLLEWLAQIIDASHLGNYYYRTFGHRDSLPLTIESEGTNNLALSPTYHAAKRRRTIRTLLFGDDENLKLSDVLKRLKCIDIYAFLLMVNAQPMRPMKTYLYMDHNILLNRDKERHEVMNFLFEPNNTGEDNVGILPIVGSNGGGKTSLAAHCFYDPKVQNHFSLKIYIGHACIFYSNLNYPWIFEDILGNWNSPYSLNYDENTLIAMVKQKLSCERFLLVLDHTESVNPVAWKALWDCLSCGKKGSKVILISNSDDYELFKKIINPEAVLPVMVDGFSEDEYMFYLKEHAFGGADPEDHPELLKVGRAIAKKMHGSLWGAVILGELLRDNLNVPFWSNFLNGGFLGPLERSKGIMAVRDTMCRLISKRLRVPAFSLGCGPGERYRSSTSKTFRELLVLGPNHGRVVQENGREAFAVDFIVTNHVFANICTSMVIYGRLDVSNDSD